MVEEKLAQVLAAHPTLKLATAGGPLSPWVACAYFAEDGLYDLRVMIEVSGHSLTNIREYPDVAVMLEHGNPMVPFAQGHGRARVVEFVDAYRQAVIAKTPASAPLMNIPTLIPVEIRVDRWFITDVPAGWLPAKVLRRPHEAAANEPIFLPH